jgi:[protein-PII] uridylyltransferase
MGLSEREVDHVAALVRHHLLLPDTATRRDIDDGTVVAMVADTIGDPQLLRMLYVLAGADGLATGEGSWSPWKASLLGQLYRHVLVALESGEVPLRSDVNSRLQELEAYDPVVASSGDAVLATMPPSYLSSTTVEDIADDLRLFLHPPEQGEVRSRIDAGTEPGQTVITVCFADRPGTLARTAGVLTLHRLSVLSAQAYSSSAGIALERFIVAAPEETNWDRVRDDIGSAYSGRLALEARLERKAMDYRPTGQLKVDVRILQDESDHSTLVEVRSQDALGLLYALTSAISDLDLNIHVAKIDTLGSRVVDVFYVRSLQGTKIDATQASELETAIRHRVGRLFRND